MNYMNQGFKTTALNIVIENTTHAGSGFGITDQGEAVFLSRRQMEVMEIEIGDLLTAHCIPNYEDKRDQIPWRAIRVDRGSVTQDPVDEPKGPTAAEIEQTIEEILDTFDDFFTTKELADNVGTDTKSAGNACLRLFNKGKIVKSDVYAAPNQERASWNLWARNTEPFK